MVSDKDCKQKIDFEDNWENGKMRRDVFVFSICSKPKCFLAACWQSFRSSTVDTEKQKVSLLDDDVRRDGDNQRSRKDIS